jgi:hypothetical protein
VHETASRGEFMTVASHSEHSSVPSHIVRRPAKPGTHPRLCLALAISGIVVLLNPLR